MVPNKPTSDAPVLGLMAGTSVDGIDASIIMTDGEQVSGEAVSYHHAYRQATRAAIFAAMKQPHDDHAELATMIADDHAEAAAILIARTGMTPRLVGFHGQTIHHDPAAGKTLQIGDAGRLAARLHVPVVCDFRLADMAAGGQGAPLAPIYHQAVMAALALPLPAAIANIGGISNISIWDGMHLSGHDTGPGNGLMDQLARDVLGEECDLDGRLAATGTADTKWVEAVLALPYFMKPGPKSLDRDDLFDWCAEIPPPSDPADRMASFMLLTAASLTRAASGLRHLVIAGGGARNPILAETLTRLATCPVTTLDDHGRDSDFLESELMAFLAARVDRQLPLTFPATTGVSQPMPGGRIVRP